MSIDRTPKQMREDSVLWRLAGYPDVAVGRYRDAADQVERLQRDLVALSQLRSQLEARYESVSRMLCDILFHLPPQAVKLEDGRVMIFKDPDPSRTLELIQGALQRAFDQARSADETSERQAAREDRAYCEGAQQALAIAAQSWPAAEKWLREGCGNRRAQALAVLSGEPT